ncbi:UNVERIFIED_CONTAM: hypothetical protein FKN15_070049 [Acipenser sinensis]
MSSQSAEPGGGKAEVPKEKDFKTPGLRGIQTTTLFRAVNPELFIKPVSVPGIRKYNACKAGWRRGDLGSNPSSSVPGHLIHSSSQMSSQSAEPGGGKAEVPKEKDFKTPGLRGIQTTTLFRAVNPELFIKPEIDAFVREFFAVVDRLPSCIAHLQSLSRQPLPNAIEELKLFCSNIEARYSALRRGLGLDELLGHCDRIVEKLRCPEAHLSYRAMAGTSLFAHTAFEMLENHNRHFTKAYEKAMGHCDRIVEKLRCPEAHLSYRAMAGTSLFAHTAFEMLENHNRITAAVDKVELLWQQALSRAQLPLKNLQHRQEALQIIEHINTKGIEKLQSYRIEIAEDAGKAEILQSEYEATIYKPGMDLIHHAEDVLLGLSELRGVMERDGREGAEEDCTEELYRVKEDFRTAIELPHHTLRAVCDFYCFLNQEIDAFVREFFAVVDRLPSCIAHLQSLSRQPLPNAIEELKLFCSNIEARYSALRRITAAVDKVELLWQQALSRAQLPLKNLQHRQEALQVPMSSSELVEAGVLGFEDDAGTSGSDQESGYCPTNSATARDIHSVTTIDFNKTAAASLNGSRAFSSSCSSSRLLQELKELHVIEEQILEENLKIHALQRFEEADRAAPEEQAVGSLLNPSKERELFLRELEKERTEVERMEKSLARERAERNTKIRNHLHSGSRKAACSNPHQSLDPAALSRAKTRLSVTSALTNRKAAVNADKGTPLSMGHTTNWPKENCSKSGKADSGEGISSPSHLVCTNMQTTLSLATMTSIRNDGCPRTPERNVSFCLDEQSQTNGQLEGCCSIHTVATGGLQCVLQSLDPFSRSCVPEESGGMTHSTPELLLTQPVLDIPSEDTQKTVDQVLDSCELSATESESMPYLTVERNEIPVPAARRRRRGCRKEEPPEPVGDPFDSGKTPAAVVAPIPKPRKIHRKQWIRCLTAVSSVLLNLRACLISLWRGMRYQYQLQGGGEAVEKRSLQNLWVIRLTPGKLLLLL